MADAATRKTLVEAVERYFELMYSADVGLFDRVFAQSAQLHGLRDASLRLLTGADYRKLLAENPSPKSKSAPRVEEILLVDFASPSQALVKVRVRIDTVQYVDYLSFHLIKGSWLITAKSFHVEQNFVA
jgi:Putative lumazine-binding